MGTEDFLAARACKPDAILLPKVDTPQDIEDATYALSETDAPDPVRLWAMIETARGMMNLGAIRELGLRPSTRLDCFVTGMNDLVKETGLDVLDGVSNQFRDLEALADECEQEQSLGFDGKMSIHPAQIEAANRVFLRGQMRLPRQGRLSKHSHGPKTKPSVSSRSMGRWSSGRIWNKLKRFWRRRL